MLKKPWHPMLAILFCLAQCMSVLLGISIVSVLHKAGVAGFRHEDDLGNILVATLSFQGVTWILIPIFLRLNQIRVRDAFGLSAWNFFYAISLSIIAVIVALVLEYVYGKVLDKIGWHPESQTAVQMLNGAPWWPTGIYLAFFAVVLAPVAEEFIFRCVLFQFFRRFRWPALVRFFREINAPTFARLTPGRWFWKNFAWIGVSLLFALIHDDVGIFVPLFFLALALTWLYEKTENLLAPIITHALFNAINLVILIYQNQ